MKKLMAAALALVMALALVVGSETKPADAHFLAPGQVFRSYANCVNDSLYGDYGNGFAQIKLVSRCSVYTGVGVITAHNGHTHVKWCNVLDTIWNTPPGCTWDIARTVLTAYAPGSAISYATNACYDDVNGFPQCVRQDHGAFMPAGPYHTPPQF